MSEIMWPERGFQLSILIGSRPIIITLLVNLDKIISLASLSSYSTSLLINKLSSLPLELLFSLLLTSQLVLSL
jgi:hypothetical protein